jgi:hypothetical protein
VRNADEIFSTLDGRGRLDGVPFMPEMTKYCGRRFRVFKRADKTCAGDGRVRRMYNAVHLENLRCDGAAHGGCQAGCLMYWKEAWLERVESGRSTKLRKLNPGEEAFVAETLIASTEAEGSTAAERIYQCQATEVPRASTPLRMRQLDQFPRDVRNWSVLKVARGLVLEACKWYQRLSRRFLPKPLLIAGGREYPSIEGRLEKTETPTGKLDLMPGDLVRIKSKDDIVATLDYTNRNRGLTFEDEMVEYCGRTARVAARVERLIDEKTGRMINIKADCIILEGVVCTANFHRFCTLSIYPYWREVWLERVS